MIILDTNVISALMQPDGHRGVIHWLDAQPRPSVWIAAISVMEIRYGILLLPEGRRKSRLAANFERMVGEALENRVLAFDAAAAEIAAVVSAGRRQSGLNVDIRDTQIAAIALSRNAVLATRNVRDFRDTGLILIDPWSK